MKRYEAKICHADDTWKIEVDDGEIFFSSPAFEHGTLANYDFALLALIIASASRNRQYVLPYPVTRSAYLRFNIYAHALAVLSPAYLTLPKVDCPDIVESPSHPSSAGGIVCLSGGFDSTYAVATTRPTHALLIQGADYPAEAPSGFGDLVTRVESIGKALGVSPIVVKTNLRDFTKDWGIQCTGFLATCLNLFSGRFSWGGYAADLTPWEDVIRHPWGNLAGVADCLTHSAYPIRYLGAEKSRAEKILFLALHYPKLLEHVSICYSNSDSAENCGSCEKCTSTRLYLQAIPDVLLRERVEMSLFGAVSNPATLLDAFALAESKDAQMSDFELRRLIQRYLELWLVIPDGCLRSTLKERAVALNLERNALADLSKAAYEVRASATERDLRTRLAQQRELIESIYASTSWRITRPVRTLKENVSSIIKLLKSTADESEKIK